MMAEIRNYVDRNVAMLGGMFEKRMRGYRSMGYRTTGFARPMLGPPTTSLNTTQRALEGDDRAFAS
ncbi:MAG: hypothetical protein R3C68_10035 [Myxococcota bacterium]